MTKGDQELDISDSDSIPNPMKRLYYEYLRDEKLPIASGTLFSIIDRTLSLVPPLMIAVALDSIFLDEKNFSLFLVPDGLLPMTESSQFLLIAAILVSTYALQTFAHYGRNWGWNLLTQRTQHNMRTDAYESMQRLGMPFFENNQDGEMMSILSNDANRLESFLKSGLNKFFELAVVIITVGFALVFINWQLALVVFLPIPVFAVATYVFVNTIQPQYEELRSTVGSLNTRLENNLGGMKIIKTSTTESHEIDRVNEQSLDYLQKEWQAIRTRIRFFPGLRLVSGLGYTLTFVIGGYWVISGAPLFFEGSISPGDFVVFVSYTGKFVWPVAQFGQLINKYEKARASTRRLLTLISMEPEVQAPDSPTMPEEIVGDVKYHDVSFSYEDDQEIISNIDIEVEEGETAALVGPTGAGKSTILKLLPRMYDVDSGSIEVDGVPLTEMPPQELRTHIGYVSQDPFLFEGTAAENVTYGSFDATREQVMEACKMAEAHEFISNLSDGYDTIVGERGVKLSGGQRQRIAIARAVLQEPEILILDEATSDVDTETEMLIQKSIEEVTEEITTFAIAHRLSTIKDADKIFVIEDGNIVENGTHDQLLEQDELYANLWYVQAGEIDQLSDEFVEKASKRRNQVE